MRRIPESYDVSQTQSASGLDSGDPPEPWQHTLLESASPVASPPAIVCSRVH